VKDQPGRARAGGIEALYPFLYSAHDGEDALIVEVTNSTIVKAREIAALRNLVAEQFGRQITECAAAIARAFVAGGRLLTFGNGGSATDACAIASTFSRPQCGTPIPAICLNADVAIVTALANDVGFENIFARQLAAFATSHDIALGISTSGNSANLMRAFEEAERRDLVTIGLAGYDGGKMGELARLDYLFIVPSSSVHRIQEAQVTIYHLLWESVQRALTKQQGTS
jgi:D-sedoheptulose 7-phosphate isomerase